MDRGAATWNATIGATSPQPANAPCKTSRHCTQTSWSTLKHPGISSYEGWVGLLGFREGTCVARRTFTGTNLVTRRAKVARLTTGV
eukprot:5264971-Amphidinium_carterae.2